MNGTPTAIQLSELRGEAVYSSDADAITERVLLLDNLWIESTTKRIKQKMEAKKHHARH